jgi:hypothetical protein
MGQAPHVVTMAATAIPLPIYAVSSSLEELCGGLKASQKVSSRFADTFLRTPIGSHCPAPPNGLHCRLASACAGQALQPAATVQPQDRCLDCTPIFADIEQHRNSDARRAGKSRRTLPQVLPGSLTLCFVSAWTGKGRPALRPEHYRTVNRTSRHLVRRSTAAAYSSHSTPSAR